MLQVMREHCVQISDYENDNEHGKQKNNITNSTNITSLEEVLPSVDQRV